MEEKQEKVEPPQGAGACAPSEHDQAAAQGFTDAEADAIAAYQDAERSKGEDEAMARGMEAWEAQQAAEADADAWHSQFE